ncbi:MAG: ABC transporter permease [Candidatus Limiplasma sp.]|nr:ABC transporter permease [Candidatus Limiplasma sp.]
MVRHVLKKLISVIPLLFIVSLILFIIIHMLPGDVTLSLMGDTTDLEYMEKVRADLGVDKPLHEQYWSWLSNVLRGDLGRSMLTSREPVMDKVKIRLPVTLELTILSILISILIAIPAGIISAVRRNSAFDTISRLISMIGIALPPFWIGILLLLLFSVTLRWLPASGYVPFFQDPIANLKSMILPALSVGIAFAATVMRQTRSAILDVLGQDYIMTARSKGLRERLILWKHALRNALIPVITVISMQIGRLIGGSVVTEAVFSLPGMGREIANSLLSRDYPVCIAMILITAVFVVLVNTLVDVIVVFIDPRISRSAKTR